MGVEVSNSEMTITQIDCSPTVGKLAAALSKAQGEMKAAEKNGKSNFGVFADLADIIEATKLPLANNALCLTQGPRHRTYGWVLVTNLRHSSGEWESSETPLLTERLNMQQFKSAVTYARRIGLLAMMNVAEQDDDGELATHGNLGHKIPAREQPATPPRERVPMGVQVGNGEKDINEKVVTFGKFKGMTFSQIPLKELENYAAYLMKGTDLKVFVKEFIQDVQSYLAGIDQAATPEKPNKMPAKDPSDPGPDFHNDGIPF